jgi:excisionase family DNA binding protein
VDRFELEKFYTVPEAAPRLGLNDQGLYRAIREGHFTAFVRIGSKIRIPESALRAWIERQIQENERKANASAAAA